MPVREVNVIDGQTVFVQPHDPEPPKNTISHHNWTVREAIRNDWPLVVEFVQIGWYRNLDKKMCYLWDEPYAPRSVIERLIAEGVSGEWIYSDPLGLEQFVVDDENSHPDIPKKNEWLRRKMDRE